MGSNESCVDVVKHVGPNFSDGLIVPGQQPLTKS